MTLLVSFLQNDALCINQADVAERYQQVRQMASVYECTAHTIIYLGASFSESDEVLGEARKWKAKFRERSPERQSLSVGEENWEREGRADEHF